MRICRKIFQNWQLGVNFDLGWFLTVVNDAGYKVKISIILIKLLGLCLPKKQNSSIYTPKQESYSWHQEPLSSGPNLKLWPVPRAVIRNSWDPYTPVYIDNQGKGNWRCLQQIFKLRVCYQLWYYIKLIIYLIYINISVNIFPF